MSNEVTIRVTAKDDTGPGFAAARRGAKDLEKDTDVSFKKIAESGSKAGAQAGMTLGRELAVNLSNVIKGLPPQVQAGVAAGGLAIGTALGVGIGAAAGGALVGAIGIGGVLGGIMLAAKDPQVAAAGTELGKSIADGLRASSSSFIGPTLAAIQQINSAWRSLLPDIQRGFQAASKYVDPLVDAFESFAKAVVPAVVRAIERAGPVIDAISKGIADTGDAIAGALDNISEHADGGAEALKALFAIINAAILGVGLLIGHFEQLAAGAGKAFEWVPGLRGEVEAIGGSLGTATGPMNDFGVASEDAGNAVKYFTDTLDVLFGKLMNADELAIAYQESIDKLTASFEKNGATLDINTEKGRNNANSILAIIDNLNRQRDAEIAAGDGSRQSAEVANAAFLKKLQGLRELLVKLGANTAAVDALIDKYRQLAAPLTKVITVKVNEIGSPRALTGGRGFVAEAHGGVVPASPRHFDTGGISGGSMAWVGEQGPELVRLPYGSSVIPSGQSRALANGNGSGGQMVLEIRAGDSGSYTQFLVGEIQKYVRVAAGGSVQNAFGKA